MAEGDDGSRRTSISDTEAGEWERAEAEDCNKDIKHRFVLVVPGIMYAGFLPTPLMFFWFVFSLVLSHMEAARFPRKIWTHPMADSALICYALAFILCYSYTIAKLFYD